MSGLVNISQKSLAVTKESLLLSLANVRIVESEQDIFKTAYKAGLLRRFCFDSFARLPKHQGGLASLYLYIQQIFRSQMANVTKNLTATANNSTRMSTANARNSVSSISAAHPLFKITKKELIALIEGKTCAPSVSDARYSLILAAFLEWIKCEDRGLYTSDIRDSKLISRLSAIREAFRSANNQNR